jgi:hypothetical protein
MGQARTPIIGAMRRSPLAFALLACGAAQAQTTTQLGWLAGCWQAVGGEPGSGDQWMAPAGGLLRNGQARTIHFPMKRMACPS